MNFKVVGIGEVLWDLLPQGPQPGGAPANFVCHARALGAQSSIVTRVGDDRYGSELLEWLRGRNIYTGAVQVDLNAPTGTVNVAVSEAGVPEYTIHENVAWDRMTLTPEALQLVATADAICFGTLAQRNPCSRETIQKLVAAVPTGCLRVCDINLRQHYSSQTIIERSLEMANVLKLNETELPLIAELFGLPSGTRSQIQTLAERFHLDTIAFTRGASGSILFQCGNWSERNAEPVNVVDTVGAGDAFTAALVLGLLQGTGLDAIHAAAAELAGYVCSQPGATPRLPENLVSTLRPRAICECEGGVLE